MKGVFVGIKEFWKHLFTDAAGRTEPKLVVAYAFLYFGFHQTSVEMFLASSGLAILLLFGISIFDHKIDMKVIDGQAEAEGPEDQDASRRIGFVQEDEDEDEKGS